MIIIRKILKIFIPTLIAYLSFALLGVIDGIMIGRAVDNGLSAMSLTVPCMYLFSGLGFTIAIGLVVSVSIEVGKKDYEKASKIFFNNFVIGAIILITLTNILRFGDVYILRSLTENDQLVQMADSYLNIMLLLYPLMFVSLLGANMMKIQGDSRLLVITGITAISVNFLTTYFFLFVLDLGLEFAAVGTGISYLCQVIIAVVYMKKSKINRITLKRNKLALRPFVHSFINGASDGAYDYSKSLISYLNNKMIFYLLGVVGLGIIGTLNYLLMFTSILFFAIADSIIPLIGISYGARNYGDVRKIRNGGVILALVIGFLVYLTIIVLRYQIIDLFGIGSEVDPKYMARVIIIFFSVFLISGVNQVLIASLTAMEWGIPSLIYSLFRNLLILGVVIILLSYVFGEYGLFISYFISEIISLFLGLFLIKKYGSTYKNFHLQQ